MKSNKEILKMIEKKIKELKKELKEGTGKRFVVYNRRMMFKKINWNDIVCRQIVMLTTLKRKIK